MASRLSLTGKFLVITGGTQGIGEATAVLAAERGAAGIVICGRGIANGERVAAKLQELGCGSLYVQADLMKVADCRKVVAAAKEKFGRIDGLVNAAAITNRGTIEETSEELFDQMFDINVRAPFFMIQETVKVMQATGTGGSIVNISSISASGGQSFITAYCASKGALDILTKNVANSQRQHKIRVNSVKMGWTATPNEHKTQLTDGNPENWLETADANAPLGRILRPRDVAGICCFLLSDEAEMMTGSVVDFDQNVIGGFD
ncbi:MAG: SDR family oxidoreductase [Chloroflexota bacterium]